MGVNLRGRIFAIYFVLVGNAVMADKDCKNMHSPCEIVINEFSHSNGFLEIGKLCLPSKYNGRKGLDRHYILIVDQNNILQVKINLSGGSKNLIDFLPLPNESVQRQTLRKLENKCPVRSGKKKPTKSQDVRDQQGAGGSQIHNPPNLTPDDQNGESVPCQQTFHGCGDEPSFQRKRRDLEENQPFVRGLSAVNLEGFNFDSSLSYGIYLLRLSSADHRKGLTGLNIGKELSSEQKKIIVSNFHDYILLTPPNSEWDQSNLTDLLPENVPARFLEQKEDRSDYSFSKCDKDVSTGGINGFIHTKPTKGKRNACATYKEKQPFSYKGKTLRPQSKEFIINVITNLNRLMDNTDWQSLDIMRASGQILNLAPETLYKIVTEYSEKKHFAPPGKRVSFSPVTDIDEEKKQLIYKIVTGYYKSGVVPYFKNVFKDWLQAVREAQLKKMEQQKQNGEEIEELYHCGARSFSKILKKQGYRYGKIRDRDSQIFRPKNIELRKSYLKLKLKYDADPNWDVLYQDETWIDTHARAQRGWRLQRFESFIQRREFTFETAKISRGARLIVLAIGGENGFVPETSEVFVVVNSKKKVKKSPCEQDVQLARDKDGEDYHLNVDGDRFFKWMEKVLKALTRPTAIVMDNCSTHKVRNYPTKSSNKDVMLQWLQQMKKDQATINEDVSDNTKLTKPALIAIIDRVVAEKKLLPTKIQQLFEDHGHKILLTPPYQPELQPIEYVWGDIKREVREKNTDQTVSHAKRLAITELSTYSTEKWRSHIRHVLKVQQEFIEGDKAFDVPDRTALDETGLVPIGPVEITIIDVFAETLIDIDDEEENIVYAK